METDKKIEWLKPERILKLNNKHKSIFGINRMLIIGIGKNGIDCALRCKHIVEKRFGSDEKKMRYIGIGEAKQLQAAECEGTVFAPDEQIAIVPEDSIYPCLNAPEELPDYIRSWFSDGLKNYSPAMPVYGLSKRQCGRLALFRYIERIAACISRSVSAFSGSDKSLEIVLTGNLGDVFFGGMFIDLAYIVRTFFADTSYSVKVNCYMFAADTAALIEHDQRELGNYYANIIIAKNELDRFQCTKRRFSQRYSEALEIISDKMPFNVCFVAAAEKNYQYTMSTAAEKIVSRMEVLFSKDDDAEHIISYNMIESHGSHEFRYLSYGVCGVELPMGKILSYLSVRVFTMLNQQLCRNSVGQMKLGLFSSKVTPDEVFLASKAGQLPVPEFDEEKNPVFSLKTLRGDREAPARYINTWLEKVAELTQKGADKCLGEVSEEIISACESAKVDISKGPFYSVEIIKKCLSELKIAIGKADYNVSDMQDQIKRSENLVKNAYRKLRTSVVFSSKALEQYIYEIKDFAEYSRCLRTGEILAEFYRRLYDRLNEYYISVLRRAIEPFEVIAANHELILEAIYGENENSCIADAFPITDIIEKLDKLVDNLTEEQFSFALRSSDILKANGDDETGPARETVKVVGKLFDNLLSMNYGNMCEFFGVEGTVGEALEKCINSVSTAAPVTDDVAISRIICPKAISQNDIARLRTEYNGMKYIWNGSVLDRAAVVTQIRSGVKLESFKDYELWENMRYAYVNDSLKKHGIHIFD